MRGAGEAGVDVGQLVADGVAVGGGEGGVAAFQRPARAQVGPPLAFHAFKGGSEEAAATLLLNHLTRNILSEDATYLRDALTALAIEDPDVPRQLEPELQEIAELLRIPGRAALNTAYGRLIEVVGTVSPREMRAARAAHTRRPFRHDSRVPYGSKSRKRTETSGRWSRSGSG